jgi:hypothetical protein
MPNCWQCLAGRCMVQCGSDPTVRRCRNSRYSWLATVSFSGSATSERRGCCPGARRTRISPIRSRSRSARAFALRSATILLDRIGEDAAGDVLRAMIRKAREGDVAAGSLILSRCWQPRRGRAMRFDLPELRTPTDLVAAIAHVGKQVSEGVLTLEEGRLIGDMLSAHARAIELQELAADVRAIKEKIGI